MTEKLHKNRKMFKRNPLTFSDCLCKTNKCLACKIVLFDNSFVTTIIEEKDLFEKKHYFASPNAIISSFFSNNTGFVQELCF